MITVEHGPVPLRIGLLPLYLELYDRCFPGARAPLDVFYARIARAMEDRGVVVERSAACRVAREFRASVRRFEKAGVDAVVTLHLAYSPSLESADALSRTALPVVVLDTTPDPSFGPADDPALLMSNHGIHGVQDLCNLLLRQDKPFAIEAGHWRESDVLDRVVRRVRAARMASRIRTCRVGSIGGAFAGMGDFQPPAAQMREAGVTVVPAVSARLSKLARSLSSSAVQEEMALDRRRFACRGVPPAVHETSVRTGLTIRRWMEEESLDAFTYNFLRIGRGHPLATVPFLEASKAMAAGKGFAGEGDVLTAALVAAVLSAHPDATFSEMFCPDWRRERVFLSHMGEMNYRLIRGKPRLAAQVLSFLTCASPVAATGCLRPGRAVWVNLAPARGGGFRLIFAPVRMASVKGRNRMSGRVHGWMAPSTSASQFLEDYSRKGGTHHAALAYGPGMPEMESFASFMGWEPVAIAEGTLIAPETGP